LEGEELLGLDVILVAIIWHMKDIAYHNPDNERHSVHAISIVVDTIFTFTYKHILPFPNFLVKKTTLTVYVLVATKIFTAGMFLNMNKQELHNIILQQLGINLPDDTKYWLSYHKVFIFQASAVVQNTLYHVLDIDGPC